MVEGRRLRGQAAQHLARFAGIGRQREVVVDAAVRADGCRDVARALERHAPPVGETILVGGMRYTSREAISRFIAAQNADESPAPTISPAQRTRQAKAAQSELAKAGI